VAAPTIGVNFEALINCGGAAYTDSRGRQWLADQYFSEGGTYTDTSGIDILNTTDDTVRQRIGNDAKLDTAT
jgi:hypothetical protein